MNTIFQKKFLAIQIIKSLLIAFVLLLSSCDILRQVGEKPTSEPTSALQTMDPMITTTPPSVLAEKRDSMVGDPSIPEKMIIWVPPQFDPENNSKAANLLKAQIGSFSATQSGVKVEIRVKAASGMSGMMESLASYKAAAPNALPSLALLTQTELEMAALKGLIYPMDEYTLVGQEADWYNYARDMAKVQNGTMGLPFAGDGMVLLYRPAQVGNAPSEWRDILSHGQPLAFAAADPQALLTLILYQSMGGHLQGEQGRPVLEEEQLRNVLQFYYDGARQGVFPAWISQLQSDSQVWEAYSDRKTNYMITWSSQYLAQLPADSTAVPLPMAGTERLTFGKGWLWALTDPHIETRQMSVRLAEHLTKSSFMSEWTYSAGYLPTRPSALNAWTNHSLVSMLGQVSLNARAFPSVDVIYISGPVLRDAVQKVIGGTSDPSQAALAAVTLLKPPDENEIK